MPVKIKLIGLTLLLLLFSAKSNADVLYDTGVIPCIDTCGGSTLVYYSEINNQRLATQVAFSTQAIINTINIWASSRHNYGETFTIALYPDNNNLPDTLSAPLHTKEVTILELPFEDGMGNNWQGFSAENWLIQPGVYWVVLEVLPEQTGHFFLPGAALGFGPANPMDSYAKRLVLMEGEWKPSEPEFAIIIEGSGETYYPTPKPTIKANGSEFPTTINQGESLNISISMDCADSCGNDADWWTYATTPMGNYYFSASANGWLGGEGKTHQGGLMPLNDYNVLMADFLPAGEYTFHVGIDLTKDGIQQEGKFDAIKVTIQ